MTTELLGSLSIYLVFALFTHALGARLNLFQLPKEPQQGLSSLTIQIVLSLFAIYLGITQILVPLVFFFISKTFDITSILLPFVLIFQFCMISFAILILFLFSKQQSTLLMRSIWNPSSILKEFGIGMLMWILSIPVVVIVNVLSEAFTKYFFGEIPIDQVAVRYLKLAMKEPLLAPLPLLLIIIAAPFVEEFLFRGVLQNWIKKHLGIKAAILLSSLCFALAHFSFSQKAANIPLILTLFVLGCYLGIIYERRRSLFAPIGLHMTFNAISCIRILFWEG